MHPSGAAITTSWMCMALARSTGIWFTCILMSDSLHVTVNDVVHDFCTVNDVVHDSCAYK